MVTSLDITPIVTYNPTIAHPLFVSLITNPNPEPMTFIDVLPHLPPTLASFDLLGRLLRDQSYIKVPGYSTVADFVRLEVLGQFITRCIGWIEQAEREQMEGLISDDRFEKGLQHVSLRLRPFEVSFHLCTSPALSILHVADQTQHR
jgi:hypothetical protein